MDNDVQQRLDRFEGKIDRLADKIEAFPVVGARVHELERRIEAVERQAGLNAATLAKYGGIFTILAVFGTLVAREIVSYISP